MSFKNDNPRQPIVYDDHGLRVFVDRITDTVYVENTQTGSMVKFDPEKQDGAGIKFEVLNPPPAGQGSLL